MATSRIGTITIAIDGEWDIDDLRSVSESLSESYGLFYPLVAEDEVVRERLQDSPVSADPTRRQLEAEVLPLLLTGPHGDRGVSRGSVSDGPRCSHLAQGRRRGTRVVEEGG